MIQSFYINQMSAVLVVVAATSTSLTANDDVASILRRRCIGCHNNQDREAGVSLLSAASLAEGSDNGPLLDPDNRRNSRLFQVLNPDSDLVMPPEDAPQLLEDERAILQRWVLGGAELPAAVAAPQVPSIPRPEKTLPLLASVRITDGDVCIAGVHHIARINPASDRTRWKVSKDTGKVTALSVSADGRHLLAACGSPGIAGHALLIDSETGSIEHRFEGHADALYGVAISQDQALIATAGYDRTILLHDRTSGQVLHRLKGHNGSVFSLAFDPSGQVLCSASADGTVKVWNTGSGKRLDTLSQPQAEQFCVVVSHDGQRIYAAGADNRIRVWKLKSRDAAVINPLLSSTFGHERPITCLTLSPDDQLLATAAEDGTVRIWATDRLQQMESLPQQSSLVTSLSFLSARQLFLTRLDGSSEVVRVTGSIQSSPSQTLSDHGPRAVTVVTEATKVHEVEDNNTAAQAQALSFPAHVEGTIDGNGDLDCFKFEAMAGQRVLLDVIAAASKSPLDSLVEILNSDGQPVLRLQLQAVRDSWFTFRGKNSDTSDDFRVFYWQEMELNDLLYSDGEVVRLWHYPRGPDSGFRIYPGFGKRYTEFDTTPTAHALQAPCYIVKPHPPGAEITSNGLPVFPIYYRNDDDAERKRGADSRLFFTAPTDGIWVARVSDARGFSGPDYHYELKIGAPRPNFKVTHDGQEVAVTRGGGREIAFQLERSDGFDGQVTVNVEKLPPGIHVSEDILIEPNQLRAKATIYAESGAPTPTEDQVKDIRFTATAQIDGQAVQHDVSGIDSITIKDNSKVIVHIESEDGQRTNIDSPLQLTIHPGQTIRAFVRLERLGENGIVKFGGDDAGRNLPHGIFVDNIGLNGLLMPEETTEREFFITAAPIVPPGSRMFFLKSNIDGITSLPVILNVTATGDSSRPVARR